MPTQIADNEFLMRCACGDRAEHIAWLIHEPDNTMGGQKLKGEHDDWYLFTSLDLRFGFWRRLWVGLKYIFRPTKLRYYGYSELVLRTQDVADLEDFIMRRRNPTAEQ